MNARKFRLLFKAAKVLFHLAMLIWMTTTIYFQFKYGWHWTAIEADEKLWDKIFGVIFIISAWLYVRSTTLIMQALCDAVEGADTIDFEKQKKD